MDDQKLYDLVTKSLSGDISHDEQDQLNNLIKDNPHHQKALKELKIQWEVGGKLKLAYDVNSEESWKKFILLRDKQPAKLNNLWPKLIKMAAMIVVTVGIGFYVLTKPSKDVIQYATNVNEVLQVVLPDSSRIWMNESTVLTLASDFNNNDRNVVLDGEAYFEIKRNKKKPFIVTSGATITQVLGTSFNINATKNNPEVKINVASGSVSFSHGENILILTKGNAAVFHKDRQLLTQIEGSQNNLAWHSKKLIFKDQRLEDVISELEEYFNKKISLATNDIIECLFTGEFEDPQLKEVLEVISITLNLQFEHKDNNYILSGTGCTNQ